MHRPFRCIDTSNLTKSHWCTYIGWCNCRFSNETCAGWESGVWIAIKTKPQSTSGGCNWRTWLSRTKCTTNCKSSSCPHFQGNYYSPICWYVFIIFCLKISLWIHYKILGLACFYFKHTWKDYLICLDLLICLVIVSMATMQHEVLD